MQATITQFWCTNLALPVLKMFYTFQLTRSRKQPRLGMIRISSLVPPKASFVWDLRQMYSERITFIVFL